MAGGGRWEHTRQLALGKQDKGRENPGSSAWPQAGGLFPPGDPLSTCAPGAQPAASGTLNSGGESQGESCPGPAKAQGFPEEAMPLLDLGPRSFGSWSLKNERCQHLSPQRGQQDQIWEPGATWEQESPPPSRQPPPSPRALGATWWSCGAKQKPEL